MYAVLLLAPVALASLKLDTAAALPPSTDAEETAAAAVAPSTSLLETGEGKAQLTAEEQAALQIVAAHLVYLDKTEEMVKRTQSMMDEVILVVFFTEVGNWSDTGSACKLYQIMKVRPRLYRS